MRTSLLVLLLCSGCAFGNAQWREESHAVVVFQPGAGDGRCSDPAIWPNVKACLQHDMAYEQARRARCRGDLRPELVSEQARFTADLLLAATMAADGYPEAVIRAYFEAVRVGGWPAWYGGECQ